MILEIILGIVIAFCSISVILVLYFWTRICIYLYKLNKIDFELKMLALRENEDNGGEQ